MTKQYMDIITIDTNAFDLSTCCTASIDKGHCILCNKKQLKISSEL